MPNLRTLALGLDIRIVGMFIESMQDYGAGVLPDLEDISLAAVKYEIKPTTSVTDDVVRLTNGATLLPWIKPSLEEVLATRASCSESGKALRRISVDVLEEADIAGLEQMVEQVFVDPDPGASWL